MKTILTVLAVAGLSGCAVYPVPAYEQPYGGVPVYGEPPPVVIYGSGVYRHDRYPVAPPPPRIILQPAPRPQVLVPRPGHGPRDSDRDGIPDRVDRDRDGDGVRNRSDRRPNDPRYR